MAQHIVRSLLANGLCSKGPEEVHCIADGESNLTIDIIYINRKKSTAEIIDPTICFESSRMQPKDVHAEKKKHLQAYNSILLSKIQCQQHYGYWSFLRC